MFFFLGGGHNICMEQIGKQNIILQTTYFVVCKEGNFCREGNFLTVRLSEFYSNTT